MKLKIKILVSFFLFFLAVDVFAQPDGIFAVNDTLCVQLGEDPGYNVLDNDILPPGEVFFIEVLGGSECFFLGKDGSLHFSDPSENCCGDYMIKYRILGCQGQEGCVADLFITIKCPKPDCFLVDLGEFLPGQSDPNGGEMNHTCAYACENSAATYYIAYNPANTYTWSVAGGTFSPGGNPAEINVLWGSMGMGTITLTITTPGGTNTTIEVCVEILEGPVADFSALNPSACLNSPISFINNSLGGNDYFWDFGDGNTSTMFEPTHSYGTAGTYLVTLYVTRNNYDANGNPLCCCSDSTSIEVEIDPLEGPDIFWISTLCAQDISKYWTNAMNCGTYNWTVLDENGLPVAFDGQGTDTICVQWGTGPFGTVMLQVADCDEAYCDEPSVVKVPIIPATADINGLTLVCENQTETYSVPKWISVYYNWQVTGGTIVSGQGTHTVTIQWGSAGVGIITLEYYSDFLGGLPGHDDPDCTGTAILTVLIQPEFEIFDPFPNPTCVNAVSYIYATSFPSANYTWSISPSASFTGQGTSNIIVTWDNGPGVYVVTAIPDDPTAYCNDMASVSVQVVEVPVPTGIDGPSAICPGETYTYFGMGSGSGLGFSWTITGGSLSTFTGNPLTVTWNNSGPYGLALQQFQTNPPFCISDPFVLTITPKTIAGPLTITGSDACINAISSYSGGPVQHPDATYNWSIAPGSFGSIISGQGTPDIQVQWNNDQGTANLIYTVSLCGQSLSTSLPVVLTGPVAPVITQTGNLCPGQNATLDGGGGYAGYLWSTGAMTQTINISSGGTYVLTVMDADGCEVTSSFQAIELPGPTAHISTPDPTILCTVPPNSATVNIAAQTQAGYTFQWYCNGTLQALPSGQSTFVHTNTNVVGTFNYWVVVTDANGCMKTSNTITVVQTDDCEGPGDGCEIPPGAYSLSFVATNQSPACNTVDFNVSSTANVVLNSWNFGDPDNNINTGTLGNATHTYSQAGYYLAGVTATVLHPQGPCIISATQSVCIPLAANFSYTENCQVVTFTDLSTYLPGHDANAWQWDFGDSNTSTLQNPVHPYSSPGIYTVTLVVSNASGCKVTFSQNVTVVGLPVPLVTAAPNPVWVGVPVNFTGSAPGIISWVWDFDDGATNGGQNPSHTYTAPGNYNVDLTVENEQGCIGTASIIVTVLPGIPPGVITYSPSLTICEGETVTLTAPAGYFYLWSSGQNTQTISVGSAGTYGVILTDANNCTLVLDPVTVIVIPKPEAFITGNLVICDDGCVTLSAPAGYGYTYQWMDDTNTPIPFQTAQTLLVCDYNLLSGYSVEVTDANGCSATSAPVTVTLAVSPVFTIAVIPDQCEGTPSTLTITPVQPDVVYSWNNGATGTSITVIQAGTFTAIGTDTLTGCSGSASVVIHPLPDLCIVPVGCYEICNPDTLCGPPGLAAYQWNMNGVPISGATDECLIVTQSGAYSLTGTTEFGCSETSDSLILQVVNCDCEGMEVSATSLDSCCWDISFVNGFGQDLFGLMIHSEDADLNFDLGSLDPGLSVYSIGSSWISLVSSTPLAPLPTGALNDFIRVCLSDVQNAPAQVVFDWYDFEFDVVCSDTLEFDCPVEPDCLYLQSDSIYCEAGQVIYNMVVCNPVDNDFNVGYIQIVPISPLGIGVSPLGFDLSGSPLEAGDCANFTLVLTGPNIANTVFCYNIIAHEFNPFEVVTAPCCSIETEYCITIPDCDPCDNIGIESSDRGEACCFTISLFNDYDPAYFDGIGLCLLDAGSGMTINNPFGSGWTTSFYSPTIINLDVAPPPGSFIPTGVFQLPEICIDNEGDPNQSLEIKWMVGDEIVCRDTLELFCEPDCGYFLNEEITCNSNGTWNYSGFIKNTSAYTMSEGHLVFSAPAGMSIYDQVFSFGSLAPGSSSPISFNIGAPAMSGDLVCFTMALHETGMDENHTNCCNIEHCFVLPDCDDGGMVPVPFITLRVGPNPSNGLFGLEIPVGSGENVHFQMYDINKKLVRSWETDEIMPGQVYQVDISNQPKGLYLLEVKTDKERWVERIVVQ